ncbi:MAG: aminotransferase class V-fold PLP-dependent enzyme [Gammaproteobacteria bacterium]|nr:aminotransferase class V-fold PLP-dependent enzyme [Gammaproteobacteria bacterium]
MPCSFREIYLDANATTPVLPAAAEAAREAMMLGFGNPSSAHCTGLKAKALMESVRAKAAKVLGSGAGKLLFVSGATEGIQTAVLSALCALKERRERGETIGTELLYGATEHKAVPETLKHWNRLLGLNLHVLAIPVAENGRHDLDFLSQHLPQAALVATMAANNETGVISDLAAIEALLNAQQSRAYWLVDSVQALGKLALNLAATRIDYAPFSGHKLYAPKGIGLLYVRQGAPFTPLMAGGGQESGLRSGTENLAGMAALGAVLDALLSGRDFQPRASLEAYREQLAEALGEAFPGLSFNAPFELSLPTTLNFSVPGFASKELLDLFDAAHIRVSSGSACSSNKAMPSYVLQAMGLPEWRAASAVRLSFGPAATPEFIAAACARIRECGAALRRSCLIASELEPLPGDGVLQLTANGACTWLVSDAASKRCVIIDPLEELTERIEKYVSCQGFQVLAVLDTHGHADHASPRALLMARLDGLLADFARETDHLGWPRRLGTVQLADGLFAPAISLGTKVLARMPLPGHTNDSLGFLLGEPEDGRLSSERVHFAFTGDAILIGGLGRTDFASSSAESLYASLHALRLTIAADTLLCPAHDYNNQFATTLAAEALSGGLLAKVLDEHLPLSLADFVREKRQADARINEHAEVLLCGAVEHCRDLTDMHLKPEALERFFAEHADALLVDVRESYEHALSGQPLNGLPMISIPLSRLTNGLDGWLHGEPRPLVFFCRSGNRSTRAAETLRRLGYAQAWHLAGGLALGQVH